jgi:histidyl-tRNA synthetase
MPIPTAPPSGFRDFLPEQVALRQEAIATITKVYKSFGFQPIATSAVEDLQVLLGKGGGENEKLIFKIMKRGEKLDLEINSLVSMASQALENTPQTLKKETAEALTHDVRGNALADFGLRFDLTLPLARYYSKHGSTLPHPFKAFQLGPVWRAERAQKGRYREFTQCDVDIIGADSWGAEVEVITAILSVFKAFGIEGVKVHLNDRRLVDRMLEACGIPADKRTAACVIIDKLDKVEHEKVYSELESEVGKNSTDVLKKILSLTEQGTHTEFVHLVQPNEDHFENQKKISGAVRSMFPNASIEFTPSLMRGMGYYTGPVFEFRHPSLSGSLGGGGRYDRLTETFGGHPIPACGGSIGFERLMMILEESGRSAHGGAPDAVVTVFSDELRGRSLEIAAALRARGLAIDVYPGAGKLKAQFKYADQKKAAYALVIGPDEAARGVVQVKDLKTGDEAALTLDEARVKIAARA